MGEIEAHLLAKLADELVDLPPSSAAPSHDRWLLASQLQKAIRRGRANFATAAAMRLLELDGRYVWRRLRVIAVEDIGLANPELVAMTIAVGGKQMLHRRWGEVRVLTHVVRRLCSSIKNRTACELACWIDFSPESSAIRRALCQSAPVAWVDTANDAGVDPLRRAIAWQLLCGMTERTPRGFRTWSRNQPELVDALLVAEDISETTALVVMRSRDTEGLGPMLPLARSYCVDEQVVTSPSADSGVACDVIDGMMAAAYCRHTRTGLAAFRHFLRQQPLSMSRVNIKAAKLLNDFVIRMASTSGR